MNESSTTPASNPCLAAPSAMTPSTGPSPTAIPAGSSRVAELPRRNGAAVMQELESMRLRLNESLALVQALQQTVSMFATRLAALETQTNLTVAHRFGSGPTVR